MSILNSFLVALFFLNAACANFASAKDSSGFKAIPVTKDNIIKIENGGKTATIPLDIEEGFKVEKFLTVDGKKLKILAYQFAGDELAASEVVAFDPKSMKEIWRHSLDGFNLSVPYVDGDFVYLSCIGHVVKKEISTGKTIWEHQDLYEKYDFNGASQVRKKNGLVEFSKNLKIDDKSGKIMGGAK